MLYLYVCFILSPVFLKYSLPNPLLRSMLVLSFCAHASQVKFREAVVARIIHVVPVGESPTQVALPPTFRGITQTESFQLEVRCCRPCVTSRGAGGRGLLSLRFVVFRVVVYYRVIEPSRAAPCVVSG